MSSVTLRFQPYHISWLTTDQAMVSGCNLLTGIVLARFLHPESFGVFVLLYIVPYYVDTVQGTLIISPMPSTAPGFEGLERGLYLRLRFAIQIGLSQLLAGGVLVLGIAFAR